MNGEMTPEAREEFLAAVDWYESIRQGLGAEFAAEVFDAIAMVEESPMMHGELAKESAAAASVDFLTPFCIPSSVTESLFSPSCIQAAVPAIGANAQADSNHPMTPAFHAPARTAA